MENFREFAKIPRISRLCCITEKIDGTNALVAIFEDGTIKVGSRRRWITPEDDNYGFAKWCEANKEELLFLGVGYHYGEWWGSGIQKRYQDTPKQFSLFNVHKWRDHRPSCCGIVPVLYEGIFSSYAVDTAIEDLRVNGSRACAGCMKPEGVVIWHHASQTYFKKTLDCDDEFKGKQ